MYRETIPALGLSLEQGTGDVPDDGRFHVVLDGSILASHSSEKRAREDYRARRDELVKEKDYSTGFKPLSREEILRRERIENELRGVQAAAGRSKRAKATRKGGKGGSGGVGG